VLALQSVDHLGQAVLHISEWKVLGSGHGHKYSQNPSRATSAQSESLKTPDAVSPPT
jgi:hypothetical protein